MRKFDDDDDDEEAPAISPHEELEHFLQRLDRFRHQFALEFRLLNSLLTRHPDLRAQYESFLRSGGISPEDFERFLDGDMRPRLPPRKGHLRLVSTRPRIVHRIGIRQPSDPPDDAA